VLASLGYLAERRSEFEEDRLAAADDACDLAALGVRVRMCVRAQTLTIMRDRGSSWGWWLWGGLREKGRKGGSEGVSLCGTYVCDEG